MPRGGAPSLLLGGCSVYSKLEYGRTVWEKLESPS
jgi:hypothetical protein